MRTSDQTPARHHLALHRVTGGPLRPGGTDLTAGGLDLLDLAPGALVLDVGCGFGASLKLLAERGYTPLGADLSPANLLEARKKTCEPLHQQARLMRADAMRLPVRSGSLDAVVCECVLSLMPAPHKALAEFSRVLVPNGGLLLADVYARGLSGVRDRPACCLDGARTRAELERLLDDAGFSLELWEDRTDLLASLSGQLIFDCGSMRDFWASMLPPERVDGACAAATTVKPGYALALARKKEDIWTTSP